MTAADKKKIYYLKRKIIFPHCVTSVLLRRSGSSASVERGDVIIAYPIRHMLDLILYRRSIATLAEVTDVAEAEGSLTLSLRGLARVRLGRIDRNQTAQYRPCAAKTPHDADALREELRKKAQELIFLINVEESDRLISLMSYLVDLEQMSDFISHYFILDFRDRHVLYRETDASRRTGLLIPLLERVIDNIKKRREPS